jgi:hypothetical protein
MNITNVTIVTIKNGLTFFCWNSVRMSKLCLDGYHRRWVEKYIRILRVITYFCELHENLMKSKIL